MKYKFHVMPEGEGWLGREANDRSPVITGASKTDILDRVIAKAKELGEASVYVHDDDGRIQEEHTFPRSSDPFRSRD